MARFAWQGSDDRGRAERGECEAPGLSEAAAEIRSRGFSLASMSRTDPDPLPRPAVTADTFTLFNRNLAAMTAIGLPLPRAIHEISAGLRRGRFRRGLEQLEAALREGKALDQAVAELPGLFPPSYRWMLSAGVASGNLSGTLSAVARNSEGILAARRALVEALSYPLVIVLVALLLGIATLLGFVPFYRDLCARYAFDIPIALDLFLRAFSSSGAVAAVAAGLAAALASGVWVARYTVLGERMLNRLPFVGRIRRQLMMARMLGAMGVLLRSGVPLPRALPVALGASGSLELGRAADSLASRASEGSGLGDLLSHAPGVSAEVAAFLKLAEGTGAAPQATLQVADLLTEQSVVESEALFVMLMPVALGVAGILVGTLLVSVVLPYREFLSSLTR